MSAAVCRSLSVAAASGASRKGVDGARRRFEFVANDQWRFARKPHITRFTDPPYALYLVKRAMYFGLEKEQTTRLELFAVTDSTFLEVL